MRHASRARSTRSSDVLAALAPVMTVVRTRRTRSVAACRTPALLLSVIGAEEEHCPVVLEAAASTSGGMLSLSVDVDERGASASSSRSRALVLAGGVAEMQHGHLRSLAARQPSVQPSRQARAVQVHHRGDAVWPGLTPGRPARYARADPGRPMVAPSRHGVPPGLGGGLGAQGAPGKRRQ